MSQMQEEGEAVRESPGTQLSRDSRDSRDSRVVCDDLIQRISQNQHSSEIFINSLHLLKQHFLD